MFFIRVNDEQRTYQQMAHKFAQKEIKPIALESIPGRSDEICRAYTAWISRSSGLDAPTQITWVFFKG